MSRRSTPRHRRRNATKAELLGRMGLRPVLPARLAHLAPDQLRTLAMAHLVNVDTIYRGEADISLLWQHLGGVLTWYACAQMLGLGEAEMQAQIDLSLALVQRFQRTGRVGFDGPELQVARDGVDVFDQLAEATDVPTALQAVAWSMAQLQRIQVAADQAAALGTTLLVSPGRQAVPA